MADRIDLSGIKTLPEKPDVAPASEPPIAKWCSRLTSAIEDIDHAIADLIVVIGPVLSPDSARESDPGDASGPQSDLASFLEGRVHTINNLTQAVRDATVRVEV